MSNIGVNWNLANEDAEMWATVNAAGLIKEVPPETAKAIGVETILWMQSGDALDSLTNRIKDFRDIYGRLLGLQRADSIATLLTTTIYAHSNAIKMVHAGYPKPVILPSLHDGCRCNIREWRFEDGTKAIRWLTARDERVCTDPIETPWGIVNGCKDLHNMIISEGPYLGKHIDEISIVVKMVACPHCGEETPAHHVRCEKCGKYIDKTVSIWLDNKTKEQKEIAKSPAISKTSLIVLALIIIIVCTVLIFSR